MRRHPGVRQPWVPPSIAPDRGRGSTRSAGGSKVAVTRDRRPSSNNHLSSEGAFKAIPAVRHLVNVASIANVTRATGEAVLDRLDAALAALTPPLVHRWGWSACSAGRLVAQSASSESASKVLPTGENVDNVALKGNTGRATRPVPWADVRATFTTADLPRSRSVKGHPSRTDPGWSRCSPTRPFCGPPPPLHGPGVVVG